VLAEAVTLCWLAPLFATNMDCVRTVEEPWEAEKFRMLGVTAMGGAGFGSTVIETATVLNGL
jgi:hypothetical protein